MASPFDPQYEQIRSRIVHYANLYGIDPAIAIWQLWQENRFRSTGCSGAGACGIAQFMPATALRFGVDRNDVESSLNGWGQYMRWLLDRPYINGDISLALAGYNAGEGRILQYGGIPPFRETQNYVSSILAGAADAGSSVGTWAASGGLQSPNTLYYGLAAVLLFLLIDG